MRKSGLWAACIAAALIVGCDRNPEDPKPTSPPPNPKPVPAQPQAATMGANANQPNIAPSPATQRRGPDTPAVGSVQQTRPKPGGDANPAVTPPSGTSVGTGTGTAGRR